MSLYHAIGRLIAPFRVGLFTAHNYVIKVPRAKVLVFNEEDEMLLLKSWGAQPHWGLPGGGAKRKEAPVDAARRELYEEVRLDIPVAQFTYVTTLQYRYPAPIFRVTVQKRAVPDVSSVPRETVDLRWFSIKGLPSDRSPLVDLALKELSKMD